MRRLLLLSILLALPFFWFYRQVHSFQKSLSCLNQIETLSDCTPKLLAQEEKLSRLLRLLPPSNLKKRLTQTHLLLTRLKPLAGHLPYLLGAKQPITYLVLLQNDQEMRANGGFTGSYAVLTVSPGMVAPPSGDSSQVKPSPTGTPPRWSVRFQDIYVPAGQIKGHIAPPGPIQQAFKQGTWLLPNFDWSPDFPTAAEALRWFLIQADEVNPDLIVTLNLTTIKNILQITGPFTVPEFNLEVDAENIYAFLQNQAELNFFPGSTQKKDALTAVGNALIKHLDNLSLEARLEIIQALLSDLDQKNLLTNAADTSIQETLAKLGWTGEFAPPASSPGMLQDTYSLIETNLGANKANCCVERTTKHIISRVDATIRHQVEVSFTNKSPLENPAPPRFYGGNYISYLRFYLPENATGIKINPPHPYTPQVHTFQEIGFFNTVKAGQSSNLSLEYSLPVNNQKEYRLTIMKQNGFRSSPQEINLFGQNESTGLESNFSTTVSL